ncbi:phosphotransferase [Rhizobium oryziradicis]|uniref:Aminoglycoside phosphotransferase domain-containing protein n=1 Tax=Rhizobium oryziradicis TaxID=1867956 RepID=A0A1Q8ZV76_9HYPH|nr:phosphotransferase [Rhizobium oryziradicis]OLP45966.1 hypothetical protein BJF95_14700 [Rhizobium oryziradicis]
MGTGFGSDAKTTIESVCRQRREVDKALAALPSQKSSKTFSQQPEQALLRNGPQNWLHVIYSKGSCLDYGLIHADLVRKNVLVDGNRIELIDFDDGGLGYRMFDIATALFKSRAEPDYLVIKAALIEGYRRVRVLPDSALLTLPLFMVLRSVTYIGWIGERHDMPDAMERLQRYKADTLALVDDSAMIEDLWSSLRP